MENIILYTLLGFLGLITVVFVFIAQRSNSLISAYKEHESGAAKRHSEAQSQLEGISSDVVSVKGALEEKLIPKVDIAFQRLSEVLPITTDHLLSLLKETGIEASRTRDTGASVAFGIEASGVEASFLIDYSESTDDLCIHSFAYSSEECDAELNQQLLDGS